jgi:hypothetical protein
MVIDTVRYYSDFDDLIKVLNEQRSYVEVFQINPYCDIDPELYYAKNFALSTSNPDIPISPIDVNKNLNYQSLIDEGIILFSLGKSLESIRLFDLVLSEYPSHVKALYWKNHVKKYAKYPFELKAIHKKNLEKELERIEKDKKK